MNCPPRLPRCCTSHPDWETLERHLCQDFPGVPAVVVSRHVSDVRELTKRVALTGPDALDIAEIIVRHQLLLLTDQVSDDARLDPESHPPRTAREAARRASARL